MVTVGKRLLTYEDLVQLPDDGNRYEIIDGELYVTPAPSRRHAEVVARLFALLFNFVRARRLGRVYTAPVDVKLARHRIVQPDILFIKQDRLSVFSPDAVEGRPDMVVEVLSPSTRNRDLGLKARVYAEMGIPEYWMADPIAERFAISVLANGQYAEVAHEGMSVRSTIVPGLIVDLDELFAELD